MTKITQIESLVASFQRDIEIAKTIQSPNPDDDLAIKAAIVGFSYSSRNTDWGRNHYLFVKKRLDSDYSAGALSFYGNHWRDIQLFASICFGYLLGLYQAGRISDEECFAAEIQIPGIIALHADKLLLDTSMRHLQA
jgi:hypothetical protein